MTNENTVTLFPCRDAATDGCPNDTSAPDTHCADCHLFHEEMATAQSLLADESWRSPADSIAAVDDALKPLIGFEVVEFKGDVDNLPVIIHAEQPADLIIAEETPKFDLNNHYTMNAAEVDCQAALYEIVAVLGKYQDTLKQIDTVLASYEVH